MNGEIVDWGRNVRKLDPQPGDVLVFSGVDEETQEMLVDTLHAEPSLDGTLIVFLGPGQFVEHLNPDMMRAYGWVKAIPTR